MWREPGFANPKQYVRNRKVQFARESFPFELILMDEYHWTPDVIAGLPNRLFLDLYAMYGLNREREERAAKKARKK